MGRHTSYTDRRRALLARRVDRLEAMEPRNMITESLGIMTMGIGIPALMAFDPAKAGVASLPATPRPRARGPWSVSATPPAPPFIGDEPPGRVASPSQSAASPPSRRADASAGGDWLTLSRKAADSFAPTLKHWAPPKATSGGPLAGGSGTGGATARGAITSLSVPAPSSGASNGPATTAPVLLPAAPSSTAPAAASDRPTSPQAASPTAAMPSPSATLGGGGASSGGATANTTGLLAVPGSGPALLSFPYFTLYTLDYNDGTVLFPGADQYGTWGGSVDLHAQVAGAAVSSYSWSYSGGEFNTSTFSNPNPDQLDFQWMGSPPSGGGPYWTDTVTLQVTDTNSHVETQTYTFVFTNPSLGFGGGGTTWPQSLAPDQVLAGSDEIASHNVSVASVSGAIDTSIPLPSYNPNIPGLSLTYDSLTADPRPIVVEHHTIDPTQSEPSQVSAQLTLNGTAGTTYYYDTSTFVPGDIQQIALQGQSGLSTGRYAYSLAIGDVRGTTTTTTVTGNTVVLNDSGSALGDGWTVSGLERVIPASGGVILDLGGGGRSLWFAGSPGSGGGAYTTPAGNFSNLALNSDGTYTRALTDGTKLNFDSGGYETSSVDRNGLRTTFAYSSGALSTITDPYNNVTTFTYSSGELSTITDPAGRVATFTHTGSNLTGVTLPDSSAWGYGYDGSGRLTRVADPKSNTTTIVYDSAERASTITRPDSSTEEFVAEQEAGWTNSGTSGSPAAATLLALAVSSYTDALGNVTQSYPDWRGMGLTNQGADALGDVTTADRDANGLATVTIDQDNRVTQTSYDSYGNPVTIIYPELNTDHYTYNGFAEPLTHTDGNGHTTSYTYDGNGNNTGIQDPLLNLTTMTYTGDGKLASVTDANNHTTSYAYDGQDRLTTVTYPDSSTALTAYDSKGNPTTVTDGRGNVTTHSYDAMDRLTGTTDPLGDASTYVYDPAGNLTADQEPLSRTTSYAYDSMDRVTTVTDPLGHATVVGYDSGGNQVKVTDPLGRVTTTIYDALDRPTVVIDPLGNRTTTTYDPASQRTNVKDPLNGVSTFSYSSNGWLNVSTDSLGRPTTFIYTNTGKLLSVAEPGATSGGNLTTYSYDADDRQVTATDPLLNTTTTTYDGVGDVIAVTDANNHTTSYAYDSRNRLTTMTDALGHATVYGYDSGGNRTTVTDALGHTTTTAYDALDRATTVTDPVGDVTRYVYDSGGRQTVVIDPNGNRTTFAYDADDRMTTQTNPNGATATFVYDDDGELTDKTDFDGRRTTYSYDSGGRQTGETWVGASPAETITYTYDSDGRLTGAADANATLTFTYDSGGNQLTAETQGTAGQPDVTLTSTYNGINQRLTLADNLASSATTTYAYDVADRLTTITQSVGGLTVALGYDAASNLTSLTRTQSGANNASLTTSYAYDAADRLTTITDQYHGFASGGSGGGAFTTPLATYLYAYDNADRLATEVNAEGTVAYSYNNADELTGASGSRSESYTYDSGGNRTMTGYTTVAGNETTASPGYTYTYDNEGNLVGETNTSSLAVTTYTYDYRDRLVGAIEKSSGGTTLMQATYAYDALDRRIETDETIGGAETKTLTVYDGDNPYADFSPGGSGGAVLSERYLYGPAVDQLLARTNSGGSTAWYLADRLGTVRDVVSFAQSSETNLDHIAYDSYGDVLSETNSTNGDRFKYAGMQQDAATGLDYDRARWYDPSIGRFVSLDPSGFKSADYNLYRYTHNDATNYTDFTGLDDIKYLPPTVSEGGGTNPAMRAEIQEAIDRLSKSKSFRYVVQDNKLGVYSLNTPNPTNVGLWTGGHTITIYIQNPEFTMTKSRETRIALLMNVIAHEVIHWSGDNSKFDQEPNGRNNQKPTSFSATPVLDYMNTKFPTNNNELSNYRNTNYQGLWMDIGPKSQAWIDKVISEVPSTQSK